MIETVEYKPNTMNDTLTLYRPVGPRELDLIHAGGYRAFPPRLPGQPIFYPVLNMNYAALPPPPSVGLIVHIAQSKVPVTCSGQTLNE